MSDWFSTLAAGNELPVHAALELAERGFVVLPGMVAAESLERLTTAYTEAVTSATGDDFRVGSTSTKVSDFVNRGAAFDNLYVLPPLLEACCQVIGGPFKLSSFHARTLRQGAPAQELHVDVSRNSADWPLLGFILMVDDFRPDNGATRFVPGSHRWSGTPEGTMSDVRTAHEAEVLACGGALQDALNLFGVPFPRAAEARAPVPDRIRPTLPPIEARLYSILGTDLGRGWDALDAYSASHAV